MTDEFSRYLTMRDLVQKQHELIKAQQIEIGMLKSELAEMEHRHKEELSDRQKALKKEVIEQAHIKKLEERLKAQSMAKSTLKKEKITWMNKYFDLNIKYSKLTSNNG